MANNVEHPKHYNQGEIECIDAIQASMTKEEFCGFLKGNVLKYIWRYEGKGGLEDLMKADFYLNKLMEIQKPKIDQFGKSLKEIFEEVDDGRFTE